MAGIAIVLDLLKKNPNFCSPQYSASAAVSAAASLAAASTPFASRFLLGFPGPQIAHCDASASLPDFDISNIRKASSHIFRHDSLKYTTKEYYIELKPLLSAFEWKQLALTSLRSFLLFYLPLLEPASLSEEDDDDSLQDAHEERQVDLVVPFQKSVKQIVRELVFTPEQSPKNVAISNDFQKIFLKVENDFISRHGILIVIAGKLVYRLLMTDELIFWLVGFAFQNYLETTVVTTRRVLERLAVHYCSQRVAWKLLKDVPKSAVRKAERGMPTTLYLSRVSRTTFKGHLLGVAATWIVQVGIEIYRFFSRLAKSEEENNEVDRPEQAIVLGKKIVGVTLRCSASLLLASIGAGIGATMIRPSAGQWIGCAVGDLSGPIVVSFFLDKFLHIEL